MNLQHASQNRSLQMELQRHIGKVIVVEAQPGEERRRYLQQQLEEQAGAVTWLLTCDRHEAGPWAGLNEWLTLLLPQIQAEAPELITQHDYELTRILPELRRSLVVRYPSLTDTAPQQEQIRNYPADRAFRIIHGIIDLLTDWFERSSSTHWVIACDRYDCSGGLMRLFLIELLRRRGQRLNLTVLIAIGPEADTAVVDKFPPGMIGEHRQLDLPKSSPIAFSNAETISLEMAALAKKLITQIEIDEIEQEIHLPRLIQALLLSHQYDQALRYQIKAAALYARKGFYEDALAYALAAGEQLSQICPADNRQRWIIESLLYTCYVALDKPLEALQVMEANIEQTQDADDRFRSCFMLAMLYIRELRDRDLEKAEDYLQQGLIELDQSDMSADIKLFHRTFNQNGLALVRYRQGRHQDAVDLCQWCYEQVNTTLPFEQHQLYRSVLLFNIAQVHDFIGNTAEAIEYFSAAMALDPNYSEYYNSRGNSYFKGGGLPQALADYQQAIERSAPYPEVWANIGQCYRHMGQFTEAIEAYSNALDLQPDQFSVLVARAQTFELLEQLDAALADYDAALTVQLDPLILANRAVLHYERGMLSAALADLNQAIDLSPDNPDLYQNRVVALIDVGDIDLAVKDLKTYLRLNPEASDRTDVEEQLHDLLGIKSTDAVL
jgi:tetratricopeptide (TPR) repeat protein